MTSSAPLVYLRAQCRAGGTRLWLIGASLLTAMVLVVPSPVHAAPASGTWKPGPGATGPDSYVGAVESPGPGGRITAGEPFLVSGWAVDRTAEGWAGIDDVQLYEGLMGAGGRMLVKSPSAMSRPDVAEQLSNPFWAASGFGTEVPSPGLDVGSHQLALYIHTPGKGWWYQEVLVEAVPPAAAPPYVDTAAALAAFLVAAQVALGPLLASLVPALRALYVRRWAWCLGAQLVVACGGLLALAPRLNP